MEKELVAKILCESYTSVGWESQTAEERKRWVEAVNALEIFVNDYEEEEESVG